VCDGGDVYGRVVASTTELRGFVREAVGDVYRYALALTVSTTRAEQLTTSAAVRLARHVDAVGAAPVSTARLNLVVRREVLDGLPRRHRRRGHAHAEVAAPVESDVRGTSALGALASLSVDERVALVLRHYDGLLLPDVAAALGVSYPEAERILQSARTHLEGTIGHFDDGTGADPYGRLVRGVPGPPDSLADRVWVTVDAALVPDYATDTTSAWGDDHAAWRVPDAFRGDDPLGWEGFDAVPVQEEHVPAAKEARRVGTTLLVGAGALLVVLAIAALTAPRNQDGGAAGSTVVTEVTVATTVAPTTVPAGGAPSTVAVRGRGGPPPDPDLQIIPTGVPAHTADDVQPLNDPTVSRPDPVRQADVSLRRRYRDGTTSLVLRRVDPDGTSTVWLVTVQGEVRDDLVGQPEVLQAWSVDGGGAIVSLQIAGHPDVRVVAGLRATGGGTWIRLPDDAQVLEARGDGSVLCLEDGLKGQELATYQVMSTAG
jgi:DNA-directed RNA polymerase specialized sigma24 family protein